MTEVKGTAEIKDIDELLKMNLAVPSYQRSYKWTKKNMADLLDDMEKTLIKVAEFRNQRAVPVPLSIVLGRLSYIGTRTQKHLTLLMDSGGSFRFF